MARIHVSGLHSKIENHHTPGAVYCAATITPDKGPITTIGSCTVDYIISRAHSQGDTITNAQEVLYWLHRSVDFIPH